MIIIIIKQKWWYCAVGHHAKYPNIDLILITRENDEHRTTSIESRNESKSLHFLILTFKSGEHQYSDVITIAITSQPTGVTSVYSTVCSGADHRKYQSSTSLAFVRGIHRSAVNSPHKGPVMLKIFPFDDVIMITVAESHYLVLAPTWP